MDIYIKNLVVHILDNTLGMPILSNAVHPLNGETNDFVAKHIEKLFNDGKLKSSHFLGDPNEVEVLCRGLSEDEEQFLSVTEALARRLYAIMIRFLDIPSGDLVCALAAVGEVRHLILLKLNYKTSFIHHLENRDGVQVNSIIQHRTTLPGAGQKMEEGVAINLENFSLSIIENKYDLEDEKDYYFSPLFLNCTVDTSGKEKIKQLEKTAYQVIDKYYGEDELEKRFEFKKAINEHVDEAQEVDVAQVAETVFGHLPQVRANYMEEVTQKGLENAVIQVNHQSGEDYYKQQRLVTDTGIEIKLPINEYDNKEKIEFITNKDGTISILIKNIKSIRK